MATVQRITVTRNVELNDYMEFDHVIRVLGHGYAIDANLNPLAYVGTDSQPVHAPEVTVECAEDDAGSITAEAEAAMIAHVESQGWELMTGYTSQYSYRGPIMHVSEFVGGRLADDILERPGLYVVVEVTGVYATEEQEERQSDQPIGWVIARKVDE